MRLTNARRAALHAALALVSALAAADAGAQAAAVRSTRGVPAGDNGSPATTADSVRLLEELDRAARRAGDDGALWHRKGLLAWGLVFSHQRDEFIRRAADIAHLENATLSLQRAVELSPDSARFWIDFQTFLLHSASPMARSAAARVARSAAEAAERTGDRALLAEARDREGMRLWRNYESVSRRELSATSRDVGTGTLEPAEFDAPALAAITRTLTGDTDDDFGGEAEYRAAQIAFEEAVRVDPASRTARRHLYMLLAERAQWERLRATAFARTQEASDDPDGWLALGLAAHRRGEADVATRAFDRGLALLDAAERARLTSLTRVLPPHAAAGRIDSATYANASAAQRARLERGYWTLADPIALTAVNEHQLEFYARVVQAELLFTVEEDGIRGADTERGDVLVRFGPPSLVLRTGGTSGDQVTEWRYPYRRFFFRTPGGFGTGKLVSESYTVARDFRQATPVVWRDAPGARPESVTVQVARFRAGGDSTAVYVSAAVPVRRLVADVGRGAASVDLGFTLFDANVESVLRDSTRLRVAVEDDVPDVRAWRGKVSRGEYGVRVDALGVASRRGASGRGSAGALPDSGFGVSDLLLAARITPSAAAPVRWTDFVTVPNAAEYRKGAPLALLWETYALTPGADSSSRYRVTVSVERASRGAVLDFAARVLAGASSAVGLGGRAGGDGRLTLSYDRQAPARAAVADYLTLDLSGAPAGRYLVRVSVTDAATKRTAATFAPFRVVE